MTFLRRLLGRALAKAPASGAFRVVLYCPDSHLAYNGRTPDERGVGGGVVARVRLLKHLASLGHEVTAYVNCDRPGIYDGVEYRHFSEARQIRADVLIATTSGGALDLTPLLRVDVRSCLRVAWVHGIPKPRGLEDLNPDFIYTPSNFIKNVVITEWGWPAEKVLVYYNGIEEDHFRVFEINPPERDIYSLVFIGHPRKGLSYAVDILKSLREKDPRFRLDVFGGHEIWGELGGPPIEAPGLSCYGLVPQPVLAYRLFQYGFLLAIQDIPEAFGMAVQEAKRAGVVVLASPRGALAELIQDGYDGFLIPAEPGSAACRDRAVQLILELINNPDRLRQVQAHAARPRWDWAKTAHQMTAHWQTFFG